MATYWEPELYTQLSTFQSCHRCLQANGYRSLHLVAERDGQPFEAETNLNLENPHLWIVATRNMLLQIDSYFAQTPCTLELRIGAMEAFSPKELRLVAQEHLGSRDLKWLSALNRLQLLFAEFDHVCQICKVHSDHSVGLRFYRVGDLCNYMSGKLQQALESGWWLNGGNHAQMPGWVKWAVHVLHQRSMCKSHWLLGSLLEWRMALHSNRRRERKIF